MKFTYFKKVNEYFKDDSSLTYFFFALLAISQFFIYKKLELHSINWPATGEIIIAQKLQYPEIWLNNFTTTNIENSPTIIYAYFLYFLGKISFLKTNGICIFGFLTHILYIPILYVLTKKLTSLYCGINIKKTNDLFISGNLILFYYLGKKYNLDLMGWNFFSINPHGYIVSFVFSIISFLLFFRNKIKSAIFIQIISCLIQPVMSLLSVILFLVLIPKLNLLKKFIPIIIAEITCLIILSLIFKQSSIDSSLFFKIYIEDRHPHHYLVSQCLDKKLFLAIDFLLVLMSVLSYKLCKKFFLHLLLLIILYSLIPFAHYYLTEKIHTKLFMELGITRAFHFTLFILYFSFIVVIISFIHRYSSIISKIHLKNNNLKKYMNIFYKKITVLNVIGIIVVVTLIPLYLRSELRFYNESKDSFNKTYLGALEKIDTPNEDVILVLGLKQDPVDFMLYSQTNLYYSDIFPFDTKLFIEFYNRRELYSKFKEQLNNTALNNLKKYRVDYILMNRELFSEEFGEYVCLKTNEYVLLNVKNFSL